MSRPTRSQRTRLAAPSAGDLAGGQASSPPAPLEGQEASVEGRPIGAQRAFAPATPKPRVRTPAPPATAATTPLLDSKGAAKYFACTEAAIRKWCNQGRLRSVKVGRLVRFRQEDLEQFVQAGVLGRHRVASPGRLTGSS